MAKISIRPGASEAERQEIDKLARLLNENWHEDGEDLNGREVYERPISSYVGTRLGTVAPCTGICKSIRRK